MKKLILFIVYSFILSLNAQDKIVTKTGTIAFESLFLTAFQDVKAVNDEVTGVLNTKTGDFACLGLIRVFGSKLL